MTDSLSPISSDATEERLAEIKQRLEGPYFSAARSDIAFLFSELRRYREDAAQGMSTMVKQLERIAALNDESEHLADVVRRVDAVARNASGAHEARAGIQRIRAILNAPTDIPLRAASPSTPEATR